MHLDCDTATAVKGNKRDVKILKCCHRVGVLKL